MDKFIVGQSYEITDNPLLGSVIIHCIKRTEKMVVFKFDCDDETVTKRIQTRFYTLDKQTEFVKFGETIVNA